MTDEGPEAERELPTISHQEASAGPGDPGASPAWAQPGRTWGKYLIEKQFGRGGQAVVFQAYDRFGAAGHVALKIARNPVPSDRAQAWMETEASSLVKLEHPNIARVVDAGCVGGQPYVATRLVEGLPLAAHAKSHPPAPKQIQRWMTQLADAVFAAHEKGVIHRDLKPSNVVIAPDGVPVIIDFGVSSVISPYRPQQPNASIGTGPGAAPTNGAGREGGVLCGIPMPHTRGTWAGRPWETHPERSSYTLCVARAGHR